MGRNKLKRGLITFILGIIITFITCTFMPDNRIVFGILTLIGPCTLILIVIEGILKRIPIILGMCSSLLLFILFKSINKGYIGIGKQVLLKIPNDLYQGYLSTYIGFTPPNFFSTEYFSLFPWIFLFIVGYFGYQLAIKKDYLRLLQHRRCRLIEYIGQHSLGMYLIHQPVIYSILWIYYQIG